MSNQSTFSGSSSQPILCKTGCGFFGNRATGEYCSKCWLDNIRQKGISNQSPTIENNNENISHGVPFSTNSVLSNPPDKTAPAFPALSSHDAQSNEPKYIGTQALHHFTRKKKPTPYKTLMAGLTSGLMKNEVEIEKEKDALRKVTGGGSFTKIDKI